MLLSKHKIILRQAFVSCYFDGSNNGYFNGERNISNENKKDESKSNDPSTGYQETLILAFLDMTEADISHDDLIAELKSTEYLIKLEVIMPLVDGFIADTLSHPLKAGKNRIVIFRELGYRGLLTEIRKLFGVGGEALLYHTGFTTGIEFAKLHKETAELINLKEPMEIFKKVSAIMFQWAGFGKMHVKRLSQDHGEIEVEDSFECELGKGRVTAYSQFVRGMIAGILAELFGKGFTVMEEECIAKGDPVCKFVLKPIPLPPLKDCL
ncbi:MAG: hypothetical protein H5T34_01885 [Candidatus Methanomethyliales bacterium]|nr:hypothetical protein [Candidatus Methanomethylicales archaeon]